MDSPCACLSSWWLSMIIINKGGSSVHDHHLMVIVIVNMIIFGSGQTDSVKVYYLDVSFCVVGRSGRESPADQNVRIPYRFMNQSDDLHYFHSELSLLLAPTGASPVIFIIHHRHNHDYHKRRERKSWCQTVFSSKTSCWCENGGWGGKAQTEFHEEKLAPKKTEC